MRKVLISVAPVQAITQDIIPEKIADDVARCYENGASMVHLHVRDKRGALTPDLSVLEETVSAIKEKCNIIIQASTGGVSDLTIEERCTPTRADWVEANSLNVGSVNLGGAPYINSPKDVEYCVEQIIKNRKIPEIEVFEIGMIKTVQELSMQFDFVKPILFSIVLGHVGASPATEQTLRSMIAAVNEFFPDKKDTLWGITHANRVDFEMIKYALNKGASTVRIGFEDSRKIDAKTDADANHILVKKLDDVIKSQGLGVASVDEARKMISIPTF